jgi:hypothetical protein
MHSNKIFIKKQLFKFFIKIFLIFLIN